MAPPKKAKTEKPEPPKPKPERKRPMRSRQHTQTNCILAMICVAAAFGSAKALGRFCTKTAQTSTGSASWRAQFSAPDDFSDLKTRQRLYSSAYDALGHTIDAVKIAATRGLGKAAAMGGLRIVGAKMVEGGLLGITHDGRVVEPGPVLAKAQELWNLLFPDSEIPMDTASLIEMGRNFGLGTGELRRQLVTKKLVLPNCHWGWVTVKGLLTGLVEGQFEAICRVVFEGEFPGLLDALKKAAMALALIRVALAIARNLRDRQLDAVLDPFDEVGDAPEAELAAALVAVDRVCANPIPRNLALGLVCGQLEAREDAALVLVETCAGDLRLHLTGTRGVVDMKQTEGTGLETRCVGGGRLVERVRACYDLAASRALRYHEGLGINTFDAGRRGFLGAVDREPQRLVVMLGAVTVENGGFESKVALLARPGNPYGLFYMDVGAGDLTESAAVSIGGNPELESQLAKGFVLARLGGLAGVGHIRANESLTLLGALDINAWSIQGELNRFCGTGPHRKTALFGGLGFLAWHWNAAIDSAALSTEDVTCISRGLLAEEMQGYPVPDLAALAAAPSVLSAKVFDVPLADLWDIQLKADIGMNGQMKFSVWSAELKGQRLAWAEDARRDVEAGGSPRPYVDVDEATGVARCVRVAILGLSARSGVGCAHPAHFDDPLRSLVDRMCQAGAEMVDAAQTSPSDVALCAATMNFSKNQPVKLHGGIKAHQMRAAIVVLEEFAERALQLNVSVLSQEAAALRTACAVYVPGQSGRGHSRSDFMMRPGLREKSEALRKAAAEERRGAGPRRLRRRTILRGDSIWALGARVRGGQAALNKKRDEACEGLENWADKKVEDFEEFLEAAAGVEDDFEGLQGRLDAAGIALGAAGADDSTDEESLDESDEESDSSIKLL